jgi:hypothetical protein
LREEPAPGLDLAGDREPVPEDLPEAVAQQHPLLINRRHAHTREQLGRRIERRSTAVAQ